MFGFLLHELYGVVHSTLPPSNGSPVTPASVQRYETIADFQRVLSRGCPQSSHLERVNSWRLNAKTFPAVWFRGAGVSQRGHTEQRNHSKGSKRECSRLFRKPQCFVLRLKHFLQRCKFYLLSIPHYKPGRRKCQNDVKSLVLHF